MSTTKTLQSKRLGILGGGQLGRMSALAAARLGIDTYIYCPEANAPASQVAAGFIQGAYDDHQKLEEFATKVDCISYEFENIPTETVEFLKRQKPVYPDVSLLQVSQDRTKEKAFLNQIGVKTPAWASVTSVETLTQEAQNLFQKTGCSDFILKTARFGYDGKGQTGFGLDDSPETKWDILNTDHAILEQKLDFECEISVIVARDISGEIVFYDPSFNNHKNGILNISIVPAPLDKSIIERAVNMTKNLAEEINLVGVLALELFVMKDGEILANEIAPRTHNSGHWSIDACHVSQFENHVRAVCELPIVSPTRHSDAKMTNLIGHDVDALARHMKAKNTCVHLYGKSDIKAGRKMGHITQLITKQDV